MISSSLARVQGRFSRALDDALSQLKAAVGKGTAVGFAPRVRADHADLRTVTRSLNHGSPNQRRTGLGV